MSLRDDMIRIGTTALEKGAADSAADSWSAAATIVTEALLDHYADQWCSCPFEPVGHGLEARISDSGCLVHNGQTPGRTSEYRKERER